MNYLAHIFLSQKTDDSILGNIMGDFTRGLNRKTLPSTIELGIKNHIEVDKYTDTHPIVLDLRTLFSKDKRRFAGIIIDVLFDYFLHKHWGTYSKNHKSDMISKSYSCFHRNKNVMPERMKKVTGYMIQGDWLGSYEELSSIGYVLDRLADRVSFKNNFKGSVAEIESNYYALEEGFLHFFPELIKHIRKVNIENKNRN